MFLCFSTISALDLLPVLSRSCSTLEVGFRKVSNFEKNFLTLLQLPYTTIHRHAFIYGISCYRVLNFYDRKNKHADKKFAQIYFFFLLVIATCSWFFYLKENCNIWFNDNHSWNSLVGPSMWRQHRGCGTAVDPLS